MRLATVKERNDTLEPHEVSHVQIYPTPHRHSAIGTLKLAGALAQLWGNAEFELPPLPRLSVVTGIALHDRAFGYLDDLPVGTEVDDQPGCR